VVPVQLVVEGARIVGIFFWLWIRIGGHSVIWHLRHGEWRCIPPIHVLHEPIGIEKVVALPVRRQRRQLARVKLRRNLFPAPEDRETIVNAREQRSYISEMRVIATLALKRSAQA